MRTNIPDVGVPTPHPGHRDVRDQWFWDQYDTGAEQVVAFLSDAGVVLEGATVADIGCGSGVMDLGIYRRCRPRALVGYDIHPVDTVELRARARAEGLDPRLPPGLEFRTSQPCHLPAADKTFDVVVSWSAFEHIADPLCVLREAKRILADHGTFMLQLWPFYHSEHGSHLWDWYPEGWAHLTRTTDTIEREVRASGRRSAEWTEVMLREFQSLNRLTLDELGRRIVQAGFVVTRFEPITATVHIPPELRNWPLSLLAISGVKLLAIPAPRD